MDIQINANIKKIKFKKQLSFNELKEELKLLKKSYKDIFEWTIEVENTGLTFITSNNHSSYIYNNTCKASTNCMYPGCNCTSIITRPANTKQTLTIKGNPSISTKPLQD